MKIAFLARNDGTDTRQTKILNSLCALGHQVIYIGWDRRTEEPKRLALDSRIGLHRLRRLQGQRLGRLLAPHDRRATALSAHGRPRPR
jgi:hypothetical protein